MILIMNSQSFWKDLSAKHQQKLRDESKIFHYKRGEVVYSEGQTPSGIYLVDKGLVGLVLLGASSGKEHLMRFFAKGQFFGHRSLFSGGEYHGRTICLEPTQIDFIPKKTVEDILLLQPDLYRGIVEILAHELKLAELQRVNILENQILPRVANSIVFLKELHPDHKWTRQEIANFCASTASTVIKAMAELEQMKLISQDSRDITILDREGLLELSFSLK